MAHVTLEKPFPLPPVFSTPPQCRAPDCKQPGVPLALSPAATILLRRVLDAQFDVGVWRFTASAAHGYQDVGRVEGRIIDLVKAGNSAKSIVENLNAFTMHEQGFIASAACDVHSFTAAGVHDSMTDRHTMLQDDMMVSMEETFMDLVGRRGGGTRRCLHRFLREKVQRGLKEELDNDPWLGERYRWPCLPSLANSACRRDAGPLIAELRKIGSHLEANWERIIEDVYVDICGRIELVLFRSMRCHPIMRRYRSYIQEVVKPINVMSFLSSIPPSTPIATFLRHSPEIFKVFQGARHLSYVVRDIDDVVSESASGMTPDVVNRIFAENMVVEYCPILNYSAFALPSRLPTSRKTPLIRYSEIETSRLFLTIPNYLDPVYVCPPNRCCGVAPDLVKLPSLLERMRRLAIEFATLTVRRAYFKMYESVFDSVLAAVGKLGASLRCDTSLGHFVQERDATTVAEAAMRATYDASFFPGVIQTALVKGSDRDDICLCFVLHDAYDDIAGPCLSHFANQLESVASKESARIRGKVSALLGSERMGTPGVQLPADILASRVEYLSSMMGTMRNRELDVTTERLVTLLQAIDGVRLFEEAMRLYGGGGAERRCRGIAQILGSMPESTSFRASWNSHLTRVKADELSATNLLEAKDMYRCATILDHTDVVARNNSAAISLRLAKENPLHYSYAIQDCTIVLHYEPKNFKALYRRGIALARLKMFSNAVADLRRALAIEPWNPLVQQELAAAKKKKIIS